MQVLKINTLVFLITALGWLFLIPASVVFADDSSAHCVEQHGDNNADYDACVAAIDDGSPPNTGEVVEEADDRPYCWTDSKRMDADGNEIPPDGVMQEDEKTELGIQLSEGGCLAFDESDPNLANNPIFDIIGQIISFLLASVGIALVLVVIIGGFQYMTAGGDPQKVAGAKKKIGFAIIGALMYIFATALLNWLVPGGLV